MYEYDAELLGKKIKVHIDDEIIKNDPDAKGRIKANLQKAFDKINAGYDKANPSASKLSPEQIQSIRSLKAISVSNYNDPPGMFGGTFEINQRLAENPNIDSLAAGIIHDSRHGEQFKRGISFSEQTANPMEKEASGFTVGVLNNLGGFDPAVVNNYEEDAKKGHIYQPGWRDKSTPKSREKIFSKMKGARP